MAAAASVAPISEKSFEKERRGDDNWQLLKVQPMRCKHARETASETSSSSTEQKQAAAQCVNGSYKHF